jgi:hypothetical protein
MIVSKFLRREDVGDDELAVTLRDVSLEDMPGDGGEQRWVLTFRELPKGLVLNTTHIRVLEKAFGGDSEDWRGKKAVLFVDESVQFKGKVVGGLRLRPLKAATAPKPAYVAGAEEGLDDPIP